MSGLPPMSPLFHLGMIMASITFVILVLFIEAALEGTVNKTNRQKWFPRLLLIVSIFVTGILLAIKGLKSIP